MTDQPRLPPKKDVALALLETEGSVYVHLDPRVEGVLVPAWLKTQPQLVLQIGLNLAVPIPDLDVGEEALSCTLSFNRRPEYCYLPYPAIFGLVGEGGRGMIWPDSVPPEVAAQAPGRATGGRGEPGPVAKRRGRLAAVPNPKEAGPSEPSPEADAPLAGSPPQAPSAEAAPAGDGSPADVSPAGSPPEVPSPEPPGAGREAEREDRGGGGSGRPLPPYLRVVK